MLHHHTGKTGTRKLNAYDGSEIDEDSDSLTVKGVLLCVPALEILENQR